MKPSFPIPISRRTVLINSLASAGLFGICGGTIFAQTAQSTSSWPQRPVKWIVSQPGGAGPDILARFIGESLSKQWGQPLIVENRPGGQNVIGAQAAARSPADGYNFFYATTAAMITNRFTFKTLPYDPDKDFIPVAFIGRSPFMIAASPSTGFKTLADALNQAKAQPEKVAMATEGPKTFSGILAASVAAMAEVSFNQVPYTKATDAIADVIGGRVALVCLPEAALITYVRSGQLQPLAISTSQRLATLPTVPTLAETFKGFEYTGWNGIFAPQGTPADIVSKVNKDVAALLKQPEMIQRLLSLGSIADSAMSPTEFSNFMNAERDRWIGIVRAIGLKPE
jgi:tripartite-type tricarboxylate transporter receptor subunit TctC